MNQPCLQLKASISRVDGNKESDYASHDTDSILESGKRDLLKDWAFAQRSDKPEGVRGTNAFVSSSCNKSLVFDVAPMVSLL